MAPATSGDVGVKVSVWPSADSAAAPGTVVLPAFRDIVHPEARGVLNVIEGLALLDTSPAAGEGLRDSTEIDGGSGVKTTSTK